MYGKILEITKIDEMSTRPIGDLNGKNGSRMGLSSMINALSGRSQMDGYCVTTDQTKVLVLIDNGQSCCEDWGYFQSEDDLTPYIGAELLKVECTDLDRRKEELHGDYYKGGVQFVDFVTSKGVFQLAVYNSHNGYYGHGIAVAIGDDVIHEDIL